ncbi:MAG TPA: FUSC family protein [Solirubrobacterales bacterium]|nr:FUSC family protein [Solirubrobacterales bacterium]
MKAAARAAIVMPAVFGFADGVIGDPNTTLVSAFGSFAVLVLADFRGHWRTRLVAYLSLFAAGAVLITVGTLCSETPWLAVTAMAVVGFAILFSGAISGYFAAGGYAALLLFILPVAVPAPASAIPARLEGWGLAAGVGIAAVMLIWPSRARDGLRVATARACTALAELMKAELSLDRAAIDRSSQAARDAVAKARKIFVGTPYRPTGSTGPTEALAFLVDATDWLLDVIAAPASRVQSELDPCRDENREVMEAAVDVLRASAANLDGEHRDPDFDRLDRARDASAKALAQRIGEQTSGRDSIGPLEVPQPSFRMRQISFVAREIGIGALRTAGVPAPGTGLEDVAWYHPARAERAAERGRSTAEASGRLLLEYAGPGSAWFRNSVRGAAALSVAVLIIQVATLQHSFWVVLATLQVLRSNALGTGATIFQALAGTVAGITVGGALIYAIGTNEAVLWGVLPLAVLLAAYAPRAISFAAGQAGFTVVILIIFNIIVPTGWTIGLLRAEDVAVGCAISLVVGALFWPRGAETLVRQTLADAYSRSADYVAAAARRLASGERQGGLGAVRTEARGAALRLDDAFRQYLSEPSARRANLDDLGTLVSGAVRVRLAAFSMSMLGSTPDEEGLEPCGRVLQDDAGALDSWYGKFGRALAEGADTQAPGDRDRDGRGPVVNCVSQALATGTGVMPASALSLLWASQHLDILWRLGAELVEPANDL